MTEFGLVPTRHHLEFQNRVLIELCRRTAVEIIAVRQAIDQIKRISAAFSENRSGVIPCRVTLPIQSDTRDELQKVQIVPAVDRHVFNLLRRDGASSGRDRRLQQWKGRADFDRLVYRAYLQNKVVNQGAVECNLKIADEFCLKSVLRDFDRVCSWWKGSQTITAVWFCRSASLDHEFGAGHANFCASDRQALFVSYSSRDCGTSLRRQAGGEKKQRKHQTTKTYLPRATRPEPSGRARHDVFFLSPHKHPPVSAENECAIANPNLRSGGERPAQHTLRSNELRTICASLGAKGSNVNTNLAISQRNVYATHVA